MKVGIVAGSMKPVTKGHWSLIQRASRENDGVRLFVSTSDRQTKGESLSIRGSDMKEVWERFLIPFLPANVKLEMVGNPVRSVYELLGEANETSSVHNFSVYSDPEDILERFSLNQQKKYFGELTKHDQVKFIGVERVGDMDVSGTQARKLLQHGMKDAFLQLMPEGVDRNAIWELLLLKSFVSQA